MPVGEVPIVVPVVVVVVVVVVHDGDSGDIGIVDVGNIRCCLPPCSGAAAGGGGVAIKKLRSASDENGSDAVSNTVRIDAGVLLQCDCTWALLFPQCDDCCCGGSGCGCLDCAASVTAG